MKVNEARICLDCEEIYNDSGPCPACGSRSNWFLVRWLQALNAPAGPPKVIPLWPLKKPAELMG